jgi:cell wall-associated NlpC family hydrolase
LWGGKTPFGIDCSGFTQMVYKQCGVDLPRDAYQQALNGKTLDFVHESKCGDLAFFDNEDGKITHVGLMLDHERIIHASGKVRIDILDHHGILNISENNYSHKLRIIKRIL